MSLTPAQVADMKNASSKITGVMTCVSSHVIKLEECKTFREDCHHFIEKAKKLLMQKQAEMLDQIKQVQDFLGPAAKKTSSDSLYDDGSGAGMKKPRLGDIESILAGELD